MVALVLCQPPLAGYQQIAGSDLDPERPMVRCKPMRRINAEGISVVPYEDIQKAAHTAPAGFKQVPGDEVLLAVPVEVT